MFCLQMAAVAAANASSGRKTPTGITRHKSERERKIGHRRVGVGGEITYKKVCSLGLIVKRILFCDTHDSMSYLRYNKCVDLISRSKQLKLWVPSNLVFSMQWGDWHQNQKEIFLCKIS